MSRRWWLPWLVFIALVVALILAFPEIRRIFALALSGRPEWVLLSAAILVGHYVVDAWLFKVGFDIVGVRSGVRQLTPIVFAALFADLAGIAVSGALVVEEVARRGQPASRATAGVLLELIFDYLTFLPFLVAAIVYLAVRGALAAYQLAGLAVIGAYVLVLVGALGLGLRRRALLRSILARIQRVVNGLARRLRRPEPLRESWAPENAAGFATAAVAALSVTERTRRAAAIGLLFQVLEWLGAYALFPAFNQPIGPLDVLAGYAVGRAFWIIGITPQGIGVVEGAMALTFIPLGVPVTTAGAIALVFRGLDFWLPLLIGAFFISRLGVRR